MKYIFQQGRSERNSMFKFVKCRIIENFLLYQGFPSPSSNIVAGAIFWLKIAAAFKNGRS